MTARLAMIAAALVAATGSAALAQGDGAGDGPGVHFVENWDQDDDGVVTLDELRTHRSDVFYMFDQDEDGILTAEEYVLFDETRAADMQGNGGGQGPGQGGLRRAAEGLTLEFNDTDGDGSVSEEEFVAKAAEWMTMLDRNGDGMVTTDDFGRN